ncbi:4Fe-4S binding protein [Slackia exigua]|nr:4Fe-4S binding protein [Slackia exigua]MDK7724651.1 4Fe-4S binding protein [Slackia exigua]MDK7726259.1 4Fe-4S binding protein [Slackia exigua]
MDEGADHVSAGDCMLCGRCVDVCPTDALSIGPAVPFPKPQAAEGASLSRPGRLRE